MRDGTASAARTELDRRQEDSSGQATGRHALSTYLLWQAPDTVLAAVMLWLLARWDILSPGWALGLFLLWLAKDLALYPLVRRTFRLSRVGASALVGARVIVEAPLAPRGQVRVQGELWRAESARPSRYVPVGARVVVRDIHGLTLTVEPEPAPPRRHVILRPARR